MTGCGLGLAGFLQQTLGLSCFSAGMLQLSSRFIKPHIKRACLGKRGSERGSFCFCCHCGSAGLFLLDLGVILRTVGFCQGFGCTSFIFRRAGEPPVGFRQGLPGRGVS